MALMSLARRWIELHNTPATTDAQYAHRCFQMAIVRTIQKRKRAEADPQREAEISALESGERGTGIYRRCCACAEPWEKQLKRWAGPITCYIGHSGACRECYTYHMSFPGPQAHRAVMQARLAEYDRQKDAAYRRAGFDGTAGAVARFKGGL